MKGKLNYLGYQYNEVLKCYTTKVRGVNYSIWGKRLTLKGVLQQHLMNVKHSSQLTY